MSSPGTFRFGQVNTKPSAPPVGYDLIYVKTDDVLYIQDSTGVEVALGTASGITSLTGDVTATGPGAAVATLSNSAVIGQVLTGFTPGPNSPVLATDSILEAFEKLQAQFNASAGNAITALTGDVSATGPGSVPATVNSVGGQTASAIAAATVIVDAATSINTASTLVERDASGNFAANIITANLTGNASTATLATNATTAVNFTGSLSGDVTGTQSATAISSPTVTGKLLTGYTTGTATPIIATNSILTAFENLQAQVSTTSSAAITALTGDATATGPGSVPITLATVNSNVGSFGTAGAVSTFTVNGKGLITAASNTTIGGLTNSNLSGSAGITGANMATNTVTNNNLAQMPGNTVKGNTTATPATPADINLGTVTEATSAVLVLTGWADATIGSPTIQVEQSGATQSGYLSSSDWNTFNSKQPAGSYITALTGDVSASGPGSAAATVNSVGGSSASSIHTTVTTVAAATSADTPSTLVERDASGNFSAGTITANLTGNATNVTGIVAIANGGTGQSTANAGFDALSPMTTAGDIIYENATPTATRLPIGTTGEVLTVVGGLPAWTNPATSGTVTSIALSLPSIFTVTGSPVTSSGTLTGTFNTEATNSFFSGPSTGSAATPTFRAITNSDLASITTLSSLSLPGSQVTGNISGNAANVTGVVPIANGGTNNSTAYTAGSIIFSNGTSLTQDNANFFWNDTNQSIGIGTTPAIGTFIDAVNVSGAAKRLVFTGYGTGSTVGTRGRFARGSLATPAAVQSGDTLNFLSGQGYGTSQFPTASTGAANFIAGETFTNTSNQTYFTVNTTPTGSVTSAEAFRVATTGVTLGPQSASTAIHQTNGGRSRTNKTITTTYTVDTTTTDDIIYCNQSTAFTITLPTPTSGRTIVIKDISGTAQTNTITVAPHASEKIEGLTASKPLNTNFGSWTFSSDGVSWWMI
jgi:hypothetical protein